MYGQFQRSVQTRSLCIRSSLSVTRPQPAWTFAHGARCQSTAVHRYSGEGNEDDGRESSSEQMFSESRKTGNSKIRHWRPHEAANLGVEALGKPAEVLILPSRERRLPSTPIQDEIIPEPSKHTLLDIDSAPVSWQEIQQNLLTVRDSITKGADTSITAEQWKEVKKVVSKSFTREQLKKYLLENCNSAVVAENGLETANKRRITTHIMMSVWNLEVVKEDPNGTGALENAATLTNNVAETPSVSKQFKVNKIALDLAMAVETRMLRDISEQCKVQIDVFRDCSSIALTGRPDSVQDAGRRLRPRLTKAPFHKDIELSDFLKLLTRNTAYESYLKSLIQKYNVRIIRRADRLSIYSFDETSLDVVQQDLTRTARSKHRNAGYSLLAFDNTADIAKLRQYPSSLSEPIVQQQLWYRQVARLNSQTLSEGVQGQDAILTQIRRQLEQRQLPTIDAMKRILASRPDALRSSAVVDLGQALFNADQAVPAILQSVFIADMPLLPQLLSSANTGLVVASQEQNIRLRLYPREDNVKLPSFEIYMSGQDLRQGLQQSLKMIRVSASLGLAIHDVLLPSERVDARITKDATLEIFNITNGPPLARHASLLKTLAAFVSKLQSQGPEVKSPIHLLDVLPLLKEPPKLGNIKSVTEKSEQQSTPLLSDEVLRLLSTIKNQKTKPLEAAYFLEPPEWLDKTIYTNPSHPQTQVEHTISAPLIDDGTGNRHTLRIVPIGKQPQEPSVADVATHDPRNLERDDQLEPVLKAAIDLARKLTMYNKQTGDIVDQQAF